MSQVLAVGYDVALCAGLVWVALRTVTVRDRINAVILFMAFGLLLALVWARLGLIDLALAEAIIGSGLTGALLLNTCRALQPGGHPGAPRQRRSRARGRVLAGLCGAVGLALAVALPATLGQPSATASAAIAGSARHALTNPVTAVLLDFRAYDTLLEMIVLLAAFLGARILLYQAGDPAPAPVGPAEGGDAPLLDALLAVATPVLVLVAIYLYWAGSHSPGGAFQAGALLGALGVLCRLSGRLEATGETGLGLRVALVLGLLVFTLAALGAGLWAPLPLSHPATGQYALVLAIELGLMVSIATTLTALFAAAPGLALRRRRP